MLLCAWFCLLLFYKFIYGSCFFSSACVKNKVLRWNSVVLMLETRLPGLLTLPAVHIGRFVFRICLNSNSNFAKISIHVCVSNITLYCCYIFCRRFFPPTTGSYTKSCWEKRLFLKVNFICKEKNLHLSKKPKINSWKKNRTKGSRLKIVCVFGFLFLCFILFFCSVGN